MNSVFTIGLLAAAGWGLALSSASPQAASPLTSPRPTSDSSAFDDQLDKRLTERAERAVQEDGLEGLVVVVGVGDDLVMQKAWGRMPGGRMAGAELPFRAEALVDPLAAIAALQLVEKGDLKLDAPIRDVLKGEGWGDETITLHHLLTHTSGMIGWEAALAPDARAKADKEMLIQLAKEQGLQSPPGSCFEYSETNALLLGAIVEAATNKSLAECIQASILEPVDVTATGFDVADAPPAQPSSGAYREIMGRSVAAPEGVHAFGEDAFCASAPDLFQLVRALQGGKLLGEEQLDEMLTEKRLTDGTEIGYGYGVNLTALGDFVGFTAGGGAEGSTVHLAHYPEPDVTVVVLVAAESAAIIPLERDLVRIMLDMPLPGVQDLSLDADEAKPFVGRYQVGCTTYAVSYSAADGRLVVGTAERTQDALLYQGGRRFVLERDPDYRVSFDIEEGEELAARMLLDDHGRLSEAVRF